MAARASRAFHEYMPMRQTQTEAARVYRKISYGPLLDVFMLDMRSYRGPNGEGLQDKYGPEAYFLGPAQIGWLKRELLASRATWKVIAADMPLSLIVVYDVDRNWGVEAIAQGDGPPRGRELEIADLLSFIKRANVRNTVWLTADVHYTAAHYYDPNKAVFGDFEAVLGVRVWVRSTPALSAPTRSTTPSGRSSFTSRRRPRSRARTCRPHSGCSSSAWWRSTARPR